MWIESTNAFRFCDQSLLWMVRNSVRPHSRTLLMRPIVLHVDLSLLVPLFGLFPFDIECICFWCLGSRISAELCLTCSVPSWWLFLCSFRKNNSTAWCFQCNSIGCLVSKFNWLLSILPWARISPCWSMNGENWRVLLFYWNFLFSLEISSLQQIVLAAIVSRCLLVHPLFLQHLVFVLQVCVF